MRHFKLHSFLRAVLFALTIALAAVIIQTEALDKEALDVGSACAVPPVAANE